MVLMRSQVKPQEYGQAVLNHVQSGAYPESEDVISAELPALAISEISKSIGQARKNVKIDIRKASRDSAPDIDGWISQAKQLQLDIQKSQQIAREVIEQDRQGQPLEEKVSDATKQVELLHGEIAFNKSLRTALERFQAIQLSMELVQRATTDHRLIEAVDILVQIGHENALSPTSGATRVSGMLEAKVTDLQGYVKQKLIDCWNRYFVIDSVESSIEFRSNAGESSSIDLDSLITSLTELNSFNDALQPLCNRLETIILLPRLQVRTDGTVGPLYIHDDKISTSGSSSDLSAQALFQDLSLLVEFLRTRLPHSLSDPLANRLMPRLVSRLISTWLASAIPEDLDGMENFEDTLSLVKQFGETIDKAGWPGKSELMKWTRGIPSVWLKKRQEISLDQVRKVLLKGLGHKETVERIETQILSEEDDVFARKGDWDAEWSDEETSPTAPKILSSISKESEDQVEEDVSAWGLDESENTMATQDQPDDSNAVDEDTEAWGWGDENDDDDNATKSSPVKAKSRTANRTTMPQKASETEREVTLKEIYNITSLPKEIMEIVNQVISDAYRLETSDYASLPIASVASDLFVLPGLILAMYRASSSAIYARHPNGQMFLYNDSIWLAERLHQVHADHITGSGKQIPNRIAHSIRLSEIVSALESFKKRVYAKEMESQRTIVADMLDGAQGFVNCTEQPFAGEIDLAIVSTVDRIRQVYGEWKNVLSHSALLQSIGSLLSTVVDKIIIAIEEMSDIPQEDSKQLTVYCNRITTLEDLFRPVRESGDDAQGREAEAMPLTPLYTVHWWKFQYLVNILESSLIDIKYMWTEGELGLEFDTEELVDLIVALFADSTHRRTAVAEIRRRKGVK